MAGGHGTRLDVYARDGVPVGGNKQYFWGLLRGTGVWCPGRPSTTNPRGFPTRRPALRGMTPDVALLHELEHAARIARGQVDNTPYSNLWLTRGSLARLVVRSARGEIRRRARERIPGRARAAASEVQSKFAPAEELFDGLLDQGLPSPEPHGRPAEQKKSRERSTEASARSFFAPRRKILGQELDELQENRGSRRWRFFVAPACIPARSEQKMPPRHL